MISFRDFAVGDIALFFPTPHGDYVAFNVGCPHHYLSMESKELIGQDKHFRKHYVLGRIVIIQPDVATCAADAVDRDHRNPYQLGLGTRFHVVSVMAITCEFET